MYVAKAPDIGTIMQSIASDPKRLGEIVTSARSLNDARGDYLHWDKLRHLTPPDGLSHEEWWLAIKLARRASVQEMPLRDASDAPFVYAIPPAVQRLLHFVDRHCSGEIAMAEVISDEHARRHYLVNSLMEEAIRSSQLEGATTTRRVAKELLRSGRAPRDRSELMILNNYRALQFIRDEMGVRLTPDAVLRLHRVLTEGTLDDLTAAGRLQTTEDVRVDVIDATDGSVVHRPPPAEQLPSRLQALCDFANAGEEDEEGFIHPVVRSILLHFCFAYDHPFEDGNGRTARALFYWHMRVHGYWMVEYLSISKILRGAPAQYGKAFLLTETDDGDTTYFLLQQLQTITRAVEELHAYLRRKMREIGEVEQLIARADGFNHRQLALLGEALRDPDTSYTYASHAHSNRVTHETARRDLLELHDLGLLRMRRSGRKHVYGPVEDLPRAMQGLATRTPSNST